MSNISSWEKAYLFKTHNVGSIRYRANHVFYSYRDIRDAMVSYHIKFGDLEGGKWGLSMKTAKDWIEQYNQA